MASDNATTTEVEAEPTDNQQTETDLDMRVEKDVLVTAYADPDVHYSDERVFMDQLFGQFLGDDKSVFDTYTEESETVELTIEFEIEDPRWGDMRTFTETVSPFSSRDKDRLKSAIKQGIINPDELDWLSATIETNVEEKHSHKATLPLKQMVKQMGEKVVMPENLGYESSEHSYRDVSWYQDIELEGADSESDETERYRVYINSCHPSDVKRRRVLTHQAERTKSNRYETPEDTPEEDLPWSFQISIHIDAVNEDEMEALSGEIVTATHQELATLDGIHKVRLTDCETSTKKRGECYNL